MTSVIKVENLGKSYHLGQFGTGTFSRDIEVWWAKMRGRQNPTLRIGKEEMSPYSTEVLWALKDVCLNVERGEVLGIIGRNGAGKSTLLKILSRVTAPTSGRVLVKGRIASLLEVGTGFHPELTGRENIHLNGAILGMSRQEISQKFQEILDFSEIEKFIDTPVKRYSSGMYVRLAFAIAAHLDPDILVVDEVLAVGDLAFQHKCLGKMGEVAGNGRTVLFVSHNMAAVQNLCNRSMLLQGGSIILEGDTKAVISRYLENTRATHHVSGDSLKILAGIKFLKEDGIEVRTFEIGEPIVLRITIRPHPIDEYVLGLGIDGILGARIATIRSNYIGFRVLPSEDYQVVECCILNLRLSPGSFNVKVAVSLAYGDDIESLVIENAFEILPSDYWGYGHLPKANQGAVIVDHKWRTVE